MTKLIDFVIINIPFVYESLFAEKKNFKSRDNPFKEIIVVNVGLLSRAFDKTSAQLIIIGMTY